MKIRKLTAVGILMVVLGAIFLYRTELVTFYMNTFLNPNREASIDSSERNEYYTGANYFYVQSTNNFTPTSKQDLKNIYYTVLDSGLDDFTFYCDDNYKDCLKDIKDLSNDQITLSHINNFVHPFNSFKNIETEFDSLGKIVIHVEHTYSDDDIARINRKVDEILTTITTTDTQEKIKAVHDYLIHLTRYDSERTDHNIVTYESDNAIGPLFQGYGICGGYTDAMAIFLTRFGLPNIKVASENHIWNLVQLNQQWYHLDVTWDDPITTSGIDTIEYSFFLIDASKLDEIDVDQHQHDFDPTVYEEATV